MTEYRKGDVCSLEVTVEKVADANVGARTKFGCWIDVVPSDLTLVRRAPVDLATCELPVRVCSVDEAEHTGTVDGRTERKGAIWCLVNWDDNTPQEAWLTTDLRPLDVPTPATGACAAGVAPAPESEVERLREALAPFADLIDLIDCETEGFSDDDIATLHLFDYEAARWRIGIFRTARAALARKDSQ